MHSVDELESQHDEEDVMVKENVEGKMLGKNETHVEVRMKEER